MISPTSPVSENDLHAYVDGQLAPERREAVEAWLEEHSDKADEIAHWQRQNEAMIALFPPTTEQVPERLKPQRVALGSRSQFHNLAQLAAAAVVLVALGTAGGWALRGLVSMPGSEALIASAVSAHALYVNENRHAVEVMGTDRDHLVSWLSDRVARPISPPDLVDAGFELVGGRLLPASYEAPAAGPAAQLMYQNAANERVTVFITAAPPATGNAYEFSTRSALEAFYWSNDRITCTVVGSLPKEQMKAVAKEIYTQLTWRPDGA